MSNWLARLRTPAAAAALGMALLAVSGALVAPTSFAEDKKQTVSTEVGKKLKPAQEAIGKATEALGKGDKDTAKAQFDIAVGLAKEGLAISTKPYDKEMSLRMLGFASAKNNDFVTYADTLEQLNQLDSVPADEKKKSYKPLAQIYGQQRNYEKAADYANKWADEGGGGGEAYSLLATIYLVQKDCKNGIVALEKSVAGREPNETELKQENFCYYQLGDKPKRQAVMETLVAKFLKREYLSDLMGIYQEQNPDERSMLNLYRFAFEHEFLTRESEFVDYADSALNVGAPAEALKVIETGISKGAVKLMTPNDRNSKMLAQAKQQTAEDKKLIAQLDKEARGGKNGEADVKVGLAYLGLGDYDKAVEAIQRGLSPDRVAKVKRLDDANMTLGIAYLKLGKKDEASKAFTAAKADPRMAKAAAVWLTMI